MEIWIIDDNIAFSFELKNRIKDLLSRQVGKLKFEVFHLWADFEEQWGLAQKGKRQKPQLVISELLLGNQNIQGDLFKNVGSSTRLLICSSSNYGGYQLGCIEQKHAESPFIEKSQLDAKLKPYIDQFLQEQLAQIGNLKNTFKQGLDLLKKIEDAYYAYQDAPEFRGELFDHGLALLELVRKHGINGLEKTLVDFIEIRDEKNLKAPRFKKILREFILAAAVFKEKNQLD